METPEEISGGIKRESVVMSNKLRLSLVTLIVGQAALMSLLDLVTLRPPFLLLGLVN